MNENEAMPAGASHGMGKHPALAVVALVVLLLGGWLIFRIFFKPAARQPVQAAIPVSTGLAKAGNIDIYLDALGTVTPVYTVTVTSRVAGELTDVYFKEGQMVKKGDLLAAIDPRP